MVDAGNKPSQRFGRPQLRRGNPTPPDSASPKAGHDQRAAAGPPVDAVGMLVIFDSSLLSLHPRGWRGTAYPSPVRSLLLIAVPSMASPAARHRPPANSRFVSSALTTIGAEALPGADWAGVLITEGRRRRIYRQVSRETEPAAAHRPPSTYPVRLDFSAICGCAAREQARRARGAIAPSAGGSRARSTPRRPVGCCRARRWRVPGGRGCQVPASRQTATAPTRRVYRGARGPRAARDHRRCGTRRRRSQLPGERASPDHLRFRPEPRWPRQLHQCDSRQGGDRRAACRAIGRIAGTDQHIVLGIPRHGQAFLADLDPGEPFDAGRPEPARHHHPAGNP